MATVTQGAKNADGDIVSVIQIKGSNDYSRDNIIGLTLTNVQAYYPAWYEIGKHKDTEASSGSNIVMADNTGYEGGLVFPLEGNEKVFEAIRSYYLGALRLPNNKKLAAVNAELSSKNSSIVKEICLHEKLPGIPKTPIEKQLFWKSKMIHGGNTRVTTVEIAPTADAEKETYCIVRTKNNLTTRSGNSGMPSFASRGTGVPMAWDKAVALAEVKHGDVINASLTFNATPNTYGIGYNIYANMVMIKAVKEGELAGGMGGDDDSPMDMAEMYKAMGMSTDGISGNVPSQTSESQQSTKDEFDQVESNKATDGFDFEDDIPF